MGQMTVEQWYGTIKTGLTKKLTENKEALPAGFNQQRFILNCITVIQDMMKDDKKKAQLEKINPETIPVCLAKAAYLGLDFFNGECYAIPYGGNLSFQTDYKGEIKLCKRYSKNKIKDIFAKVVRQGDFFMEEVDGGKQNVQYRPKPFSNEQMIGAFAIVAFEDGSMMYDTMSSEDIENVRNTYSKVKDSQAWKSSTGEMYKKTVLRRLCKLIDLDFDNIEQQKAYEDGGDVVFNQQSLPGATTGQALLPENDKPVDAFAAIKAQKQAEPVIDGMILEEA